MFIVYDLHHIVFILISYILGIVRRYKCCRSDNTMQRDCLENWYSYGSELSARVKSHDAHLPVVN